MPATVIVTENVFRKRSENVSIVLNVFRKRQHRSLASLEGTPPGLRPQLCPSQTAALGSKLGIARTPCLTHSWCTANPSSLLIFPLNASVSLP